MTPWTQQVYSVMLPKNGALLRIRQPHAMPALSRWTMATKLQWHTLPHGYCAACQHKNTLLRVTHRTIMCHMLTTSRVINVTGQLYIQGHQPSAKPAQSVVMVTATQLYTNWLHKH